MIVKHYKSIEKLSQKDCNSLLGLIESCYFISNKIIDKVIDPEKNVSVFCAYDELNNLFAFASVKESVAKCYLTYLFVDEAFRGYGFGEKLLKTVCNYASKTKKESVILIVSTANDRAISLYSKNHFIKTGKTESGKCLFMKKYTSNEVYQAGSMLYELAKKYGHEQLLEGLTYARQNSKFSSQDQKFQNISTYFILHSSYFENACALLQEMAISKGKTLQDLIIDKIYQKNLVNVDSKNKFSYKSALVAEACLNFERQKEIEDCKFDERIK